MEDNFGKNQEYSEQGNKGTGRRSSKKVVIIGLCVFLAGLIVFTVGLALEDFDIEKISTVGQTTESIYSSVNTVNAIEIIEDDNPIVICRGNSDSVKVYYYENDNEKYTVEELSDGTLLVNKKKDNSFKWFSFDFSSSKLCIEVPESFNGDINVKNENGRITVENVTVHDMKAETSDGRIVLTDITASEDIKADTSNGRVEISGAECNSLSAETSDGRIVLDDVKSIKNIAAMTSNGSIHISSIDAGEAISLETSDGSVKGVICGKSEDYNISSETDDGSNNLPNQVGGEKSLRVKTDDGSIKVSFEK